MIRLSALLIVVLMAFAAHAHAGDWPPPAPDLSLTLIPETRECLEAGDCRFIVRLENHGTAPASAIALISTTSAPSTLGPQSDGLACSKQAYSEFNCDGGRAVVAPGAALDLGLVVRFLPTPMPDAEVCAALDWPDGARSAAESAVFSALGKKAGDVVKPEGFLAAIHGTWGTGDLRGGNDKNCVRIALGASSPVLNCAAGERQVSGQCVPAASLCTSGRNFDAASQSCDCPASAPNFDAATMACVSASVAMSCEPGRGLVNGQCVCPREQPVWTGSACTALQIAQENVAPAAEPEPAPPQVVSTVKTKAKPRAIVATKPRIDAQRKVKPRAESIQRKRKVVKAKRPPKRTAVKAAAGRKPCPPLFVYNSRRNYCWPGWLIDPDVAFNGPLQR